MHSFHHFALYLAAAICCFATTGVNGQVDCSNFQFSRQLADLVTLDYVVNAQDTNTGQGTMTTRLTYEGLGWLGFGVSPDGINMVGGEAVIGSSAGVLKYELGGKAAALLTSDGLPQTLTDTSFTQNETHTVLEYTKILQEDNEFPLAIDGSTNNFMWAYGNSNDLIFHIAKGFSSLTLAACDESGTSIVAPQPTVAPSVAAAAPTELPTVTPASGEAVDCSEFQQSVQLGNDLLFEFVVNPTDDGTNAILSGRLTLDGEGWIGLGVNENGNGAMTPSDAIIGIPALANSDTNPGKYDMTAKALSAVQLMDSGRQTLTDSSIVQENGQTIMVFNKILTEDGETSLQEDEINTFIWAFGRTNTLGQHLASDRGAFQVRLRVCDPAAGVIDDDELIGGGALNLDTYQELWTAHGSFAGIAWGILCPLAVASSILRKFFPAGPIWFTVHMSLNMTVFLFTLVAFFLAVAAQEKSTLDGEDANHFTNRAHSTVGLIIMCFTLVQVIGGIARPHTPSPDEEKKPVRFAWEVVHRGAGFAILAAAWWQVQDGLGLYATRFGSTDLRTAFWIVIGCIGGIVIALKAFSMYGGGTNEEKPKAASPGVPEQTTGEHEIDA